MEATRRHGAPRMPALHMSSRGLALLVTLAVYCSGDDTPVTGVHPFARSVRSRPFIADAPQLWKSAARTSPQSPMEKTPGFSWYAVICIDKCGSVRVNMCSETCPHARVRCNPPRSSRTMARACRRMPSGAELAVGSSRASRRWPVSSARLAWPRYACVDACIAFRRSGHEKKNVYGGMCRESCIVVCVDVRMEVCMDAYERCPMPLHAFRSPAVRVGTCLFAHLCTRLYSCRCTHLYTCLCARLYTCLLAHACTRLYTRLCTHLCMCLCI